MFRRAVILSSQFCASAAMNRAEARRGWLSLNLSTKTAVVMANLNINVVSNWGRYRACYSCSSGLKGGGKEEKKIRATQDARLLPTGRQLASCANDFHVRFHVYDCVELLTWLQAPSPTRSTAS